MILRTTRLSLRPLSLHDLDAIHHLLSLPETDEYNTLGIPDSILATQDIVEEWLLMQHQDPRISYVLGIERLDTKQFIGLIALNSGKINYKSAEVWYLTHRDHWRQGYTTEALKKIIELGFTELKLHRIEAGCAVANIGSIKVLEKSGMKREGMKRKKLPIRGEWKDNYCYAILEEDFFSTQEE